MSFFQLTLTVFTSGCLLWLGLYLIGRNYRSLMVWPAGGTLITYGIRLMLFVLDIHAPRLSTAQSIAFWQIVFTLLPILFWIGFLVRCVPREQVWRQRMQQSRIVMIIILVGTILFALGIGLIQIGLSSSTRFWVNQLLAFNLLVMGTAVAALDATEQGEALWPHYLRSFDYAFFTALLFGTQVALVMKFAAGVNFAMLILLFATVVTAVIVQTFSSDFTTWLDRVAFFTFPRVRRERATLRAGAEAAARVNEGNDPTMMEPEAFARLTRKALSQMGNLPRLAASPLTQLPLIIFHLDQQGIPADTLARATALKQMLTDSIARLKPDEEELFGTTDGWRHYNALYFPYVRGLRPYRRRPETNNLDRAAQDALNWFRTEVPPRTLYNWQTAAARLVARDLQERSHHAQNGRNW